MAENFQSFKSSSNCPKLWTELSCFALDFGILNSDWLKSFSVVWSFCLDGSLLISFVSPFCFCLQFATKWDKREKKEEIRQGAVDEERG